MGSSSFSANRTKLGLKLSWDFEEKLQRLSANRTKLGLKSGTRRPAGRPWRCANRTKLGLKFLLGAWLELRRDGRQSNKAGIEIDAGVGDSGKPGNGANRTKLGLKWV